MAVVYMEQKTSEWLRALRNFSMPVTIEVVGLLLLRHDDRKNQSTALY